MDPALRKALDTLARTPGLHAPRALTSEEKAWVRANEHATNKGVFACLARDTVIAVWHDKNLRPPAGPITAQEDGKTVFPPVPWPELPGAVSASPGEEVHAYLSRRAGISRPEWASLLVGL